MGNYVSDSTEGETGNEKRKITPQLIYDSLSANNKGTLIGGLIVCGALLLVALLFVFIINQSGMEPKWATVVKSLIMSVPVIVALLFVYWYWRGLKKLANGGFVVITDTADRVVTDDRMVRTYNSRGAHYKMEHAMYMYRCGRVVISLEETYLYSDGDIFYVVVSNKDSNVPLLMYNAMLYDLEDIEIE